MQDLIYIFQAFLKVGAEMLGTFLVGFVLLLVREIYQTVKNRRRLI